MTFETGLDEIGLEMKQASKSRLRGDTDKDALLREAYDALWLMMDAAKKGYPNLDLSNYDKLLLKIKTALGDV